MENIQEIRQNQERIQQYKYEFVKPYNAKITISGVVKGKELYKDYRFNVGDIIIGSNDSFNIVTYKDNGVIFVPVEYVKKIEKYNPEQKSRQNAVYKFVFVKDYETGYISGSTGKKGYVKFKAGDTALGMILLKNGSISISTNPNIAPNSTMDGGYSIIDIPIGYLKQTSQTGMEIRETGMSKKYRVIKEIKTGSGFLSEYGKSIPFQSLVPKVGDIVYGEITDNAHEGVNQRGINIEIKTKEGGSGGTSRIVIPEENLEEISSDKNTEIKTESSKSKILTKKNVVIGGAILLVLLGFFAYKKGWI
jgi:hypothetical protein